jgi:DNA (cytosine-5)-methyltransferase 1
VSTLTSVSLFAGAGGLDLGLEAAGFQSLAVTDIDFHSCRSLEANQVEARRRGKPFLKQSSVLQADVKDLSGRDLLRKAGIKRGELDLLAGGPPCQAFSVFGKRKGTSDPRGQMVYHYLRLLGEIAPKAFILENVFGLLTIEGGDVIEGLIADLQNPRRGLKYDVTVLRLNAVNYGVPQFRDRVFIIGSRTGSNVHELPPTFVSGDSLFSTALPWRTVEDALRGLPDLGEGGLANHTGRKHSDRIVTRYASLVPGERDPHTRINKLDLDRPSFAIIVGSDKGGGKGHVHPIHPREVTPRESARIQCFPDWWWLSGTSRHPIRQVGNAVPTLLGYAVGRAVIEDAFADQARPFDDAVDALDQRHLFTNEEWAQLARTGIAS